MGKLEKLLVQKLTAKAKAAFAENKKFFSKPDNLIAVGIVGITLLNELLKKLKKKSNLVTNLNNLDTENQKELAKYLKSNQLTKAILSYSSNSLDEDYLSSILLACERGDPKEIDIIESDNLLKALSDININDINIKVGGDRFNALNNLATRGMSIAETLLPFALLIIYIIQLTKDLLTRAEHPSKYRLKYIQKLIRVTIGLMKANADKFKEQLDMLMQIDTLLVALSLATFMYFKNRQILQKRSRESLKEISAEQACGVTVPDPIDGNASNTKPKPFIVPTNISDFYCPVDLDNTVTPKEPFESKQANFTCDVFEGLQTYGDADEKIGLATKAIIKNIRKSETLIPIISIDSYVDVKTPIGTLVGLPVYAPVEGYIDSIATNRIVIRDIEDTSEDYLNEQIDILGKNYARINDIKLFMNAYYIVSEYPVMLSIAKVANLSLYPPLLPLPPSVNIAPRYATAVSQYEAIKKQYDKDIKNITGEANAKKHSENETLDLLQKDIEDLQDMFYKSMKKIKSDTDAISKVVNAKPEEYALFEYYFFNLSQSLNAIENPNDIEKTYTTKINDYVTKRYFLDKYKIKDIESKLNDLIKDLEKGISLGNWFNKIMDQYNDAKTDKINAAKNWLTDIADKNNKLDAAEKIAGVNKIMYLFEFYLRVKSNKTTYSLEKTATSKTATIEEGTWINNFFGNLWKELDSILISIETTTKIIDGLSLFSLYSITEIDNESYRLYTIADEPTCSLPDDMTFIPGTGYNSRRYWLKYCAFATLASVTNPVTGWSTGIPPPIGPIPLPVIYIPIKPITTKYGFVVIGLSICGMYVFPWLLFANLSSGYNTPLGDPTKPIKNEVKALKKELTKQFSNLKKSILKGYLDKTKAELNAMTSEIARIKEVIRITKENKPMKPSPATSKQKLEYLQRYEEWITLSASLKEQLLTLKTKRWTLEKKYKIVFQAYSMGGSVKGTTEPIEKAEAVLTSQFDKLTALVDKIDLILAPLPITMQPNSANFGITIKNPKPLAKIAKDLDDNVNGGVLDKLVEPFKLKHNDLMSPDYNAKLSNSVINYKKYRTTLSLATMTIVQKDPFPSYQNLKLLNIPWVLFLYKDWVSAGAKQYGFPGFTPMPIG